MNTQKTETIIRSARRFESAIAILNDANYEFKQWTENPLCFTVFNGRGDCYFTLTDLKRCTCEDFQKHGDFCKHLFACEELLEQQAQIEQHYDPNEFAL